MQSLDSNPLSSHSLSLVLAANIIYRHENLEKRNKSATSLHPSPQMPFDAENRGWQGCPNPVQRTQPELFLAPEMIRMKSYQNVKETVTKGLNFSMGDSWTST